MSDELRTLPLVGHGGMADKLDQILASLDGFTPEMAQKGADAITYTLRRAGVIGYLYDPTAAIPSEDEWGKR